MQLSYDEIRRIHRLEKSSSRLVEVEPSFYNDLNSFLDAEKKDYLDSLKDFSVSKARDFANLKKMIEEIFSMRQKKLLSKAISAARSDETKEEAIAAQEKELLGKVVEVLEKHNALLEGMFDANGAKKGKSEGRDLNILSVKILSGIPAFVGTDLKEYGPFREGASAELPYKIAKLLSARNLCKIEE
ncbi:MAG: hypothetical protein V1494_02190 [Candidatus Diapherotrites archaeon]